MIDDVAIEKESELALSESELVLVNSKLIVTVLPFMGAKIAGIERRKSGTQFLQQANRNLLEVELPEYGQSFAPPYASGFDDCFPTVSPCTLDLDGEVVELPDHGELWTSRWDVEQTAHGAKLTMFGKQMNYRFTKWIRLEGESVIINYEVENLGETAIPYNWSSHPLLAVDEGDEIMLPDEVSDVVVNGTSDDEIGMFGDRLPWPELSSELGFRPDSVQYIETEFAGKFFTNSLKNGLAGLYRNKSDESIYFRFNTEESPYLGIWLCYGGWPESLADRELTVALEPCSSRPDSLQKTIEWDEQITLNPGEVKRWKLELSICDGKPISLTNEL